MVAASPSSSDFFTLLGLREQFDVDKAALERAYHARASETHPDRFAAAPASERVAALQRSKTLNEAYTTLRSPVARAEYLLARKGLTIGDNERVDDQAMLLDFLEKREQLAEARAAGKTDVLEALCGVMKAREKALVEVLGPAFDGDRLDLVKAKLIELRYVARYLEECEAALEEDS